MAKSWSGFHPQNQDIKDQWSVLEMGREDIERHLRAHPPTPDSDLEDEELELPLKILDESE